MRRRVFSKPTIGLGLAALAALALAACDHDTVHLEVVEGEPLELGELEYNVQITRFLNAADPEDAAYLRELPPPPLDQEYLGVFVRILNHGDAPERIPASFEIRDTRDKSYESIEVGNPFALELGAEVPSDGELPSADTPAASGPIKGALLLYLVDLDVVENRPLELEVAGPAGETGTVELDI